MSKGKTALFGLGGGLLGAFYALVGTFWVAFIITAIFFVLKVIPGTAVNEQWAWWTIWFPFYIWGAIGVLVGIIGTIVGVVVGKDEDTVATKLRRYGNRR